MSTEVWMAIIGLGLGVLAQAIGLMVAVFKIGGWTGEQRTANVEQKATNLAHAARMELLTATIADHLNGHPAPNDIAQVRDVARVESAIEGIRADVRLLPH